MAGDLIELLSRLVAIDSVNPSLVRGGAGEAEIASFVADWSRDAGLEAELLEENPGRPTAIVRARGSGDGRTLLLCAHLDTVSVDGMTDPHVPRIEADRLYGRGAYDMKAGLAAALIACREAATLGLAGDVVVAAVADEEYASFGVEEALRAVSADAAIVTEPTELQVAVAHRGFIWLEAEVTGRAAHGSRPHLGVDAIVKAGPILTAIGELDDALHERTHPLVGRGSVHASVIWGGVEWSSYPAQCVIRLERRTLPGETPAQIQAELDSLLARCSAADEGLVAEGRTLVVREPFEVSESQEIVTAVLAAAAEAGSPSAVTGVSFWADSAFISAAGIPTVLYGSSGAGAHSIEEWVSIADTETVARTLVGVASRFCA